MKSKLSIALATFNEEKNIVNCLESVKSIADEIVIVDGTSKDRTADLARRNGATVIKKPNPSMFHINKNIAITNCTGNWILLLDADEVVSKRLAKEILLTINSNPEEDGFWVNRKNWFLGGFLTKGGAYPDAVIRLFRNGKGILPEKSVHEQVKVEGKVGSLSSDILHFADPNFTRYLERANRYTERTAIDFKTANVRKNIINTIHFLIIKPIVAFLIIYIRHRGYKDGFRGFIWAFFSAAHYFYAYSKYLTTKRLI